MPANPERRPSAAKRGYGRNWRRARARFLTRHPLCATCAADGRVTEATVVDHVVPHRGDRRMFWDVGNWQALCAPCHDRHKQRQERSGRGRRIGADGWPVEG